jgi:hypothetical protein
MEQALRDLVLSMMGLAGVAWALAAVATLAAGALALRGN